MIVELDPAWSSRSLRRVLSGVPKRASSDVRAHGTVEPTDRSRTNVDGEMDVGDPPFMDRLFVFGELDMCPIL